MLEVKFYDTVDDSLLKFAVIISQSNGKWVFCKHKERDTYEAPGGHREAGEDILETAKREVQCIFFIPFVILTILICCLFLCSGCLENIPGGTTPCSSSCFLHARTSCRVCSLTPGFPFNARDTVDLEMPSALAISMDFTFM